ncbi:MAG: glycosyltransferase family 2 protein [Dermatophilaceae bacterium]|nr:glycosyltransferase [Intrasporangiaceae bacterium]
MGNRPQELAAAVTSLLDQKGVRLDILVVGNGWHPTGLPSAVRTVHLEENVGIPEGRNIGARASRGELIFFFDDDAVLPTTDVLARLADPFVVDPELAVAQPRGADPVSGQTARRWVPRLRARDGGAGGEVAVFWEGVCCVRREAFERVGGWPGHFWYGHEGIDLALRLIDDGWRLRYLPEIEVHHPATTPQRHAVYYRMNARNRVWVARRNLPWALAVPYLVNWVGLTMLRERPGRTERRQWFAGFAEGWRSDPGRRDPISWRSAWRMTRLGRPPVL